VTSPPITGSHLAQVTQAWAKIPPQRRQEKRVLTLVGILLLELAIVGYNWWHWPAWAWGVAGYFGGHFAAGDYRRLILNGIAAGLKDAAELAGRVAAAGKAVRRAIWSILGKNGNGSPPA
jgi:hypothetical protein